MKNRDNGGQGESAWQAKLATGATVAWDPYDVWLTRVKQPRERSALRPPPERPAARDVLSPSAVPSPADRWNPLRRAASPRS
jgi:hypothetical protein